MLFEECFDFFSGHSYGGGPDDSRGGQLWEGHVGAGSHYQQPTVPGGALFLRSAAGLILIFSSPGAFPFYLCIQIGTVSSLVALCATSVLDEKVVSFFALPCKRRAVTDPNPVVLGK
jgi:hypothetical protein